MKIISLGKGFISEHLPYDLVQARIPSVYPHFTLENIINIHKPDVIINCIGKTGRPNIDWCENNKSETYFSNVILPAHLADICEKKSIYLIHLSSGCIFFDTGLIPQSEESIANPRSYYSKTKYAADLILGDMKNVACLRIRMPISDRNHSRNLLNKLISYENVLDEQNSVTFMSDLVRTIDWFTQNKNSGIYNCVNPGSISPFDIMTEYSKLMPNHKFNRISSQQLTGLTLAPRSNCILDTTKLNNAGLHLTPVNQILGSTLFNYIKGIHESRQALNSARATF